MICRVSGIYEISNSVNGKRYIGSAVSIADRWKAHRVALRRGKHDNRHLQAAWEKHGESAFRISCILICGRSNLLFFEQRCMDVLHPEYNILPIAGSRLGIGHSAESRKKMSAAMKGNKNCLGLKRSQAERNKHRGNKRGLGNRRSMEFRRQMSERNKGNQYARGAKRSDAFREHRSRIMKATWAIRKQLGLSGPLSSVKSLPASMLTASGQMHDVGIDVKPAGVSAVTSNLQPSPWRATP